MTDGTGAIDPNASLSLRQTQRFTALLSVDHNAAAMCLTPLSPRPMSLTKFGIRNLGRYVVRDDNIVKCQP